MGEAKGELISGDSLTKVTCLDMEGKVFDSWKRVRSSQFWDKRLTRI